MQKVDYLIVGGALSGICLADSLAQNKQSFALLTSPEKPAASAVAAGTWNPLVFRKYTLSWRFESLYEGMKKRMAHFEILLNEKIFESLKIQKVISSASDQDFWKTRAADPAMEAYMRVETEPSHFPANAVLAEISNGGRIHLKNLLHGYHQYASQQGFLIKKDFEHSQLQFESGYWNYENISAKNILFCEGAHVQQNPFFNWLPFKPANGDTITIHAPGLKLQSILKKNIFVLPLGQDHFQVGATYNWENLSWKASENARKELEEKLKLILNVPYEVVSQSAGIRPATHDRRPFVGEHPEQKGLYLFNGMGSKGVLIAPKIAEEFVDHILHGTPLDPEVDLKRCLKYYSM